MIYHKVTQKIYALSYKANQCLHAQMFNYMTLQTKTTAPMTMESPEGGGGITM